MKKESWRTEKAVGRRMMKIGWVRWKTEVKERHRVTSEGQYALSADIVDFGNRQVLFTFLVALGQHPPY